MSHVRPLSLAMLNYPRVQLLGEETETSCQPAIPTVTCWISLKLHNAKRQLQTSKTNHVKDCQYLIS